MSKNPIENLTFAPAISPSLVPSDIPDTSLPYGPPPPKLVEMETNAPGISKENRRRVRALANNANAIRHSSQLNAAICWHEAGRLLERLAGRVSEAWICYNRALTLFPDHKPALSSLRKLARKADAKTLLNQLTEALTDRATNPIESAALLTESAIIHLAKDPPEAAIDALREATRMWPKAIVPNLIKAGLSVKAEDDEELAETLQALLAQWPESTVTRELCMILALLEERLGRLDAALERLNKSASESQLPAAAHWARVRLSLRLNRPQEAFSACNDLLPEINNPVMLSALRRLRTAIILLAANDPHNAEPDNVDSSDPIWSLELFSSARANNRTRQAKAAKELRQYVRTDALKEALAALEELSQWTPGKSPSELLKAINPESVIGRAVVSFLQIKSKKEPTSEDRGVEGELFRAVSDDDAERVQAALSVLKEHTAEERDRWALTVAESQVLIDKLARPEEALSKLKTETDRLNRAPLPTIIRSYDSERKNLAELAIAEAEDAEDDEYKAWRFGWAAHHMESEDRDEAERLHLRSLELMPASLLSVSGLERLKTNPETLAEVCMNAAEVVRERDDRVQYLLRAGVYYLATGLKSRSATLLSEALTLCPEDHILRRSVLRLSLSDLSIALPEHVQSLPDESSLSTTDLFMLGSLSIFLDPSASAKWFEMLLAIEPDDPIAKLGHEEALLRAGRATVVSGNLLSSLRQASSPQEEAAIYLRLADIDYRYEDDPPASVLSLMSLAEKLKGHRPTLARLATHFIKARHSEDLPRIFGELAHTLTDDEDAAAFASAVWHIDPVDLDLLRIVAERNPSAILELAQLEGLTEDVKERTSLLERLIEHLGESAIYLSRLAEALGDAGDHKQAAELTERVLSKEPGSLFDLFALAQHRRVLEDFLGLNSALSRINTGMTVPEYRVEALLEALEIARDKLKDKKLAIQHCIDILEINPQNEEAYAIGRKFLGLEEGIDETGSLAHLEPEDNVLLARLIHARLHGVDDPKRQWKLHLETARVLLETGDADDCDRAKEAIGKALTIAPKDMNSHHWLANIHRKDEEWTEAIEHLTAAAHLVSEPEVGIVVFYALGELYMDHTEHQDLAEKSFIKVLTWDRSHFQAMERLSRLYLRTQNFKRASQAFEYLIRIASDTSIKVENMVALAEIMEKHLNRSKDAEKLLEKARRLDPLDFEPIDALATLFKNQGDTLALNIHLDTALASQAGALQDHPDNREIYDNIKQILLMKEDKPIAAIAEEAAAIVSATRDSLPPVSRPTRWDVGARMGNPVYDAYLCPTTVPPGLREIMKAVEEPVAKHMGVSAKQLDTSRFKIVDAKNHLAVILAEMAPAFGLEKPEAFLSQEKSIYIAPGSPASIVFPEGVAKAIDPAIPRFAVTLSLQLIRHGLALATAIPKDKLRKLLAGAISLSTSGAVPKGMDPKEVKASAKELEGVLSSKIIDHIRPFAFDSTDTLNKPNLDTHIWEIGLRSGFLGAGSLSATIAALRTIEISTSGNLSELPGAGRLMAFVFSKDHMELRNRLGI